MNIGKGLTSLPMVMNNAFFSCDLQEKSSLISSNLAKIGADVKKTYMYNIHSSSSVREHSEKPSNKASLVGRKVTLNYAWRVGR